MKKKLFSLLTALVLCLLCAVPAFAEMPLVMDTYELFKPEATAELEQKGAGRQCRTRCQRLPADGV